jgi:hypothetical protein
VTRRSRHVLSHALLLAVATFAVLPPSAFAQRADEAEVQGRIQLVTSSVSTGAHAPAYAMRLIVGDSVITVIMASNTEMSDAAGRPRSPSQLRPHDVVRVGGTWESADRFPARWLVWQS